MKLVPVLVAAILLPAPGYAQRIFSEYGTAAAEPHETAKVAAIAASTFSTLLNVGVMALGEPSYFGAGASIGLGLGALALTTTENPAYETELYMTGAAAIATGLVAIRYRHVLNHREKHVRLEPAWNDGGPAMALRIDF